LIDVARRHRLSPRNRPNMARMGGTKKAAGGCENDPARLFAAG
jgi:hypothetical protein